MPDLGPAELIIVLVIAVFIFGGTRLAELGGAMGKGVREFRSAIKDDEPLPPLFEEASSVATAAPVATIVASASGSTTVLCGACHTPNAAGARFCIECGAALVTAPAAAVLKCPACNTDNARDARFCIECGGSMTTPEPSVVTTDA